MSDSVVSCPRTEHSRYYWALREVLVAQEQRVATTLAHAEVLGTPYGEETVTESMLLELARQQGGDPLLSARTYERRAEAQSGADWMWAFRGRGGGIYAFLVQAKRWHRDGYRVNQRAASSLTKEHSGALLQRDVLLDVAQQLYVPALYAFYVPQPLVVELTTRCSWEWNLGQAGGVALADARKVDVAAQGQPSTRGYVTADVFASISKPMSCALLCSHGSATEIPLDRRIEDGLAVADMADSQEGRATGEVHEYLEQLFNASRAVRYGDAEAAAEEMLGALGVQNVLLVDELGPEH